MCFCSEFSNFIVTAFNHLPASVMLSPPMCAFPVSYNKEGLIPLGMTASDSVVRSSAKLHIAPVASRSGAFFFFVNVLRFC